MKPNNPCRAVLKRIAVPCAAAALALALPTAAHAADVRLMVDVGHGGKDPGAVWGPVKEKNTNLTISKMVAESAKRQGWAVGMTRKDDRFIPLAARPAKAKAFKATATVSIHSNSAGSKKTGNMTIYRDTKGKRLGRRIMDELGPMTDYKDIGNRPDSRGLAVLRGAKNPTVIVEILSVSNKEENARLRDPQFQRETAEAIVKGVATFHGVDYRPPVVKKAQPASKAAAPAAETTPAAPLKATPNTPVPARGTDTTDVPELKVDVPAPASEPVAPEGASKTEANVAEDVRAPFSADRGGALARRTPTGGSSWIGRVLQLLTD